MADIKAFREPIPTEEKPDLGTETIEEAGRFAVEKEEEAKQRDAARSVGLKKDNVYDFATGEKLKPVPQEVDEVSELDLKIEEEIAKNPEGWITNVLAMGGSPHQITKGLEKAMKLHEDQENKKAA